MVYCTKSGSVYEVDHQSRMVRRVLGGRGDPKAFENGIWEKISKWTRSPDGRMTFWTLIRGNSDTMYTITSPVEASAPVLGIA